MDRFPLQEAKSVLSATGHDCTSRSAPRNSRPRREDKVLRRAELILRHFRRAQCSKLVCTVRLQRSQPALLVGPNEEVGAGKGK